MNQENIMYTNNVSFKDFLFKNKRNRVFILGSTAAIILQFCIFKYLYPYASYIHGDSFSYINAATHNLDINTYMIGYSKFLRLISVFTKSDLILTALQYLLIQSSILFLLFTIFYHYKPHKFTEIILLIFMTGNPLFLHLANLISSDCLFTALSFFWFALMLWIVYHPSSKIIISCSIVLFLAFTIRYNALIYPVIFVSPFFLSKLPFPKKLLGISVGLLLCGSFFLYTSQKYKELTGFWQYSPFSGWQLTNNAMYIYRYVDSAERKPVPKKFQALDNMVRQYFDSTRDHKRFPIESYMASTFYMWSPGLTMFKYRDSLFKKDTISIELKKWAAMGPLYKSYGLHIIKSYPFHFIRYFIWPNANKYYAPPVEFMEDYNSGKNTVNSQTKDWFQYKSTNINTRMRNTKVLVLNFYPIMSGVINLVVFLSLIFYVILKGWQTDRSLSKTVFIAASIWLLNAVFTICASSAALRFQAFPILVSTILAALLVDWMIQLVIRMKMGVLNSSTTENHKTDILQKPSIGLS